MLTRSVLLSHLRTLIICGLLTASAGFAAGQTARYLVNGNAHTANWAAQPLDDIGGAPPTMSAATAGHDTGNRAKAPTQNGTGLLNSPLSPSTIMSGIVATTLPPAPLVALPLVPTHVTQNAPTHSTTTAPPPSPPAAPDTAANRTVKSDATHTATITTATNTTTTVTTSITTSATTAATSHASGGATHSGTSTTASMAPPAPIVSTGISITSTSPGPIDGANDVVISTSIVAGGAPTSGISATTGTPCGAHGGDAARVDPSSPVAAETPSAPSAMPQGAGAAGETAWAATNNPPVSPASESWSASPAMADGGAQSWQGATTSNATATSATHSARANSTSWSTTPPPAPASNTPPAQGMGTPAYSAPPMDDAQATERGESSTANGASGTNGQSEAGNCQYQVGEPNSGQGDAAQDCGSVGR